MTDPLNELPREARQICGVENGPSVWRLSDI